MSNQLTRRDFAIRGAGFGLALGLAPAATLAEAEQASRSETSPADADRAIPPPGTKINFHRHRSELPSFRLPVLLHLSFLEAFLIGKTNSGD